MCIRDRVGTQRFRQLEIGGLRLEQFIQRDVRAGLVPLDSNGPATLAGQKTFERHKQIRTQTSLLAADRFQISVFEQTREKFLNQILSLLSCKALPPDKPVKRSPISSTEYFECFPCSGRFALRFEHDAPMSGGECHCIKG